MDIDWRCEPGDDTLPDGRYLFYVSTKGREYSSSETDKLRVQRGAIFTFRIMVKENGQF